MMTIEDCLRDIRRKAGMLRYLAEAGAMHPQPPDAAALGGVSDVCEEIEAHASAVYGALRASVLTVEVKGRR
jgi:hypothetical protein